MAARKCCSDWPASEGVIDAGGAGLKIADTLALGGTRGCYLFHMLDINPEIRDAFCDLFVAMDIALYKVSTHQEKAKFHEMLVIAGAFLECSLPSYWMTSTKHHLVHILEKVHIIHETYIYRIICSVYLQVHKTLFVSCGIWDTSGRKAC